MIKDNKRVEYSMSEKKRMAMPMLYMQRS